jgi:TMEM175 potassium channel family protein
VTDRSRRAARRYERQSPELEFDRVVFFSDAVFAIAMTLLVVGIGIPSVPDKGFEHALGDKIPEITSFFVSFIVIGYYWLAHHRFVGQLVALEGGIILLNLVYLAAIAFMPFPTALVGKYEEFAITVVIYAITLGTASLLEVAMFARAQQQHLFRSVLPPDVFRYGVVAALIPVIAFAISIPIAFVDPTIALLSWLLVFPVEGITERRMKPPEADELLP